MFFLLYRCQIRHINHASINIATSISGGRRWHGMWWIRWSPAGYWRSLQLVSCVMWRSGLLLTNLGNMRWNNDWIIQWRRHRYHQWWKISAIWVTFLGIKAPVIPKSVLWRSGWLLTNQGQLRWIDDRIIQRETSYHYRWYLFLLHWIIQS